MPSFFFTDTVLLFFPFLSSSSPPFFSPLFLSRRAHSSFTFTHFHTLNHSTYPPSSLHSLLHLSFHQAKRKEKQMSPNQFQAKASFAGQRASDARLLLGTRELTIHLSKGSDNNTTTTQGQSLLQIHINWGLSNGFVPITFLLLFYPTNLLTTLPPCISCSLVPYSCIYGYEASKNKEAEQERNKLVVDVHYVAFNEPNLKNPSAAKKATAQFLFERTEDADRFIQTARDLGGN